MNIKKLIESVISQLAYNDSITSMVAKLQVISKLLNNEEFKSWISTEFINGYNISKIPEYRNVSVSSVISTFVSYQGGRRAHYINSEIPIINLGVELYDEIANVAIIQTVTSIDQILIDNKGDIHLSLSQYEKLLIQQKILKNCDIMEISKIVPREYFQDIVSKAKTKLLDLFLELNETVFDNEINFSIMEKKEEISQIVNHTINTGVYITENATANINNSNMVGGNGHNISFSDNFKKQVFELTEKIEELSKDVEVDRDDIAFEISKIRMQLENGESPKLIKSAFNAIKGIASSVAADQITQVLNQSLPNISF